jgi:hypothetical protein
MIAALKEYIVIALRWCSINFLKRRIKMIPEIEEEFPMCPFINDDKIRGIRRTLE